MGLVTAAYLGAAGRLRDSEARKAETELLLAREEAERARAEAEARRADSARGVAETLLYANRIMRARYEWRDDEVVRAGQILAECPLARRGWEWRYVRHLCRSDLFTL